MCPICFRHGRCVKPVTCTRMDGKYPSIGRKLEQSLICPEFHRQSVMQPGWSGPRTNTLFITVLFCSRPYLVYYFFFLSYFLLSGVRAFFPLTHTSIVRLSGTSLLHTSVGMCRVMFASKRLLPLQLPLHCCLQATQSPSGHCTAWLFSG